MATLAASTGRIVKMRLGDIIAERKYNFRQDGVDPERVDMYYRMLCNGSEPPLIVVDARTKTIFDGMHRRAAWRKWAEATLGRQGKDWRGFEIDVLLTDEAPDRDSENLLWLVETAKRNRLNGQPPKRSDILLLVKRLIREYPKNKELARKYALEMNESNASFEEEWRKIHPPAEPAFTHTLAVFPTEEGLRVVPVLEAIRQSTASSPTPAVDLQRRTPTPASQSDQDPLAPRLRVAQEPVILEPVTANKGETPVQRQRHNPPIVSLCKQLRQAIEAARGDFSGEHKSEMEHLYADLRKALNK